MIAGLIKRTIQSVIVLFIVSIIVFYLIHTMPGTPYFAMHPSPEIQRYLDMLKHSHLLDRPIWVQYFHWIGQLVHGDFGMSMKGNFPVFPLVVGSLQGTLRLVGVAWVMALVITIPWAVYNSAHQYGASDLVASFLGFVGFAFPLFWLSLMLQQYIAFELLWLPPSSLYDVGHEGEFWNMVQHMIMPWFVMTWSLLVTFSKYIRNSMLEVLPSDYIRSARAKGASEMRVLFRHAFRNALIPFITILGLELPNILCNAALVEIVFNLGGIGTMLMSGVQQHEYTEMMGAIIAVAVISVVGNWLVDVIYMVVDPRIRRGSGGMAL